MKAFLLSPSPERLFRKAVSRKQVRFDPAPDTAADQLDREIHAWAEAINRGDWDAASAINARIKDRVSGAFAGIPALTALLVGR